MHFEQPSHIRFYDPKSTPGPSRVVVVVVFVVAVVVVVYTGVVVHAGIAAYAGAAVSAAAVVETDAVVHTGVAVYAGGIRATFSTPAKHCDAHSRYVAQRHCGVRRNCGAHAHCCSNWPNGARKLCGVHKRCGARERWCTQALWWGAFKGLQRHSGPEREKTSTKR